MFLTSLSLGLSKELAEFKGQELSIAIPSMNIYMVKYDPDLQAYTGPDIELINHVSKRLNFKIKLKSKQG